MASSDSEREHEAVVDAVARLTGDITSGIGKADVNQLRALVASSAHARAPAAAAPPITRPIAGVELREALRAELASLPAATGQAAPLIVQRRDIRESVLDGRLLDEWSGLVPAERLGPFLVQGGAEVWFDVFFAARRLSVIDSGATSPAIVLSKAHPPAGGATTINIDSGTVWIRGDLVSGGLPGGAYVGIAVSGGRLRLTGAVSVSGDTVTVAAPLRGELQLELAAAAVTPAADGCDAGAQIALPGALRLDLGAGPARAGGFGRHGEAPGPELRVRAPDGRMDFVPALWTMVLEYQLKPHALAGDWLRGDLIELAGTGQITRGGLGLPVVVPGNPAILGETARAPDWWLEVHDLDARWYVPDVRSHRIGLAWLGISDRGTLLYAEGVAPLVPAVSHAYALWAIAGSNGQRVPWRQTYAHPFTLIHRCDAATGEDLLVTTDVAVAVDRPVDVVGSPIATPATRGAMLLHRSAASVTATLAALIAQDGAVQRLALENALVWTTRPLAIFVRGPLLPSHQLDAGTAQLVFGIHAWVPTLPDPYVANFAVRGPRIERGASPRSLLIAAIAWLAPETPELAFAGQLVASAALVARPVSPGDPRRRPASTAASTSAGPRSSSIA